MTKRMLIDATHPEETRVTVVSGNRLEEFDYETTTKTQLKGNIYLAKVTRVEPSLQAAFVEYGGNRHGFLAFSEIHPDYYRIPVADREELVEDAPNGDDDEDNGDDDVEDVGGDEGVEEAVEEAAKRRPRLKRQYKIQEVIKRRQVMLVQVVKEERGNKGAALTTYLSLAGRYCVLMPNTSRGGGVSRKISSPQDRKRLKTVLSDLNIPDGMAVILRTAGAERSRAEIKRDYEYISRLWDDIRTKTLESTAPFLIHEEGNLVKRAVRDLYSKDIEEVLVAGDEAYRVAKNMMKALIPSHAKKVQPYKDNQGIPLFHRYQVEQQLAQIHDPTVHLRSGGSIVIHQTEALVAIDVNSGKATRERHIEETALKTNLEAAEEVARQLRLRDLAGLIVIDFIDMDENRNDHAVERKLKDALRRDRARIQVGRISGFGLLEMSRQRLRPSLIEAISKPCPTCGGVGYIVSTETAALMVTRAIEEEGLRNRSAEVTVRVPSSVALYILNNKRRALSDMEAQYDFTVSIETDDELLAPQYEMDRVDAEGREQTDTPAEQDHQQPPQGDEGEGGRKSRRRGGRRRRRWEDEGEDQAASDTRSDDEGEADGKGGDGEADGETRDGETGDGDGDGEPKRRRRKRGRRGGRRRNKQQDRDPVTADSSANENEAQSQSGGDDRGSHDDRDDRQVGGRQGDDRDGAEVVADARPDTSTGADTSSGTESADEAAAEEAPKPRGRGKKAGGKKAGAKKAGAKKARGRKPATDAPADEETPPSDAHTESDAPAEEGAAADTGEEEKPKTRRSRKGVGKKARGHKPEPEAAESTSEDSPEPDVPAPQEPASESPAREPEPARPETSHSEPAHRQEPAQPEPAKEEAAVGAAPSSTDQGDEDEEKKPRKRGWWNRVLG